MPWVILNLESLKWLSTTWNPKKIRRLIVVKSIRA